MWLFLDRNRRALIIVLCGVLIVGLAWISIRYWHGGCAGSKADRAVAADMKNDPLLTILPAGATSMRASSTYFSCQYAKPDGGRLRPPTNPLVPAVQIFSEYQLANPMTATDLHNHHRVSLGRVDWRLTHAETGSLTYCRKMNAYRVVSLMTLVDRRLTITTMAWTDGAPCAAEVTLPH
jgi:hypothetical protein